MVVGKSGGLFMVKRSVVFVFLFLMLSSFSFAKDNDAKLKSEYGPYLTHAPYFLRFAFAKAYKKDWNDSYYYERRLFLVKYEADQVAQKIKDKEEARIAADRERERKEMKKAELQKEKDRWNARSDEEKAEKDEYDQRQREMNDAVKQQKQAIQDMEQSLQSGRSH